MQKPLVLEGFARYILFGMVQLKEVEMKSTLTIIGVCALVLALTGCATPCENAVGRYFQNRGLDFLDVLEVGVESGKSFRANVEYAAGIAGFGVEDTAIIRLGQRSMFVQSDVYQVAPFPYPVGTPLLGLAYWWKDGEIEEEEYELFLGYQKETEKVAGAKIAHSPREDCPEIPRYGCITFRDCGPDGRKMYWARMFPVGAEAVWLLGARVRVYPVELLDLLGGVFGADIGSDDLRAGAKAMPEVPVKDAAN